MSSLYLEQVFVCLFFFFHKGSKELINSTLLVSILASETKVTSEQSGYLEFFPLPPTPLRSRENRNIRHLFCRVFSVAQMRKDVKVSKIRADQFLGLS